MFLNVVITRVKAVILFLATTLKRAMCLFNRKQRRDSGEFVPLTAVLTDAGDSAQPDEWTSWDETNAKRQLSPVQEQIEQYRAKNVKRNDEERDELNFFEDMTPKIVTQTKVLVKNDNALVVDPANHFSGPSSVNLTAKMDFYDTRQLEEWSEQNAWDAEDDVDPDRVLQEQRRLEREKRAWEQHQKRLTKSNKQNKPNLGARLPR